MAKAGRQLCRLFSPTHWSRVSDSRTLKAVLSWLVITFKDEGSTISLDNLFQCLANLKQFFLMFKWFSCTLIHTHCLSSFHCLLPGVLWLHFLYFNTSRNQTITSAWAFSHLLLTESFRLSPDVTGSNPPTTFMALHRTHSILSISPLYPRTQNWIENSSGAQQTGRGQKDHIGSSCSQHCLKQPREPGAAPATSTCCCLMATRMPGPFSTKLLSRHSGRAWTRSWGYCSPAADLALPSAHEHPVSPFLQPLKLSGNGSMTLWGVQHLPVLQHLPTCSESSLPCPGH